MIKNCLLIILIFLFSSCTKLTDKKPTDNENLQIKIIEEGSMIEISDVTSIYNQSEIPTGVNSMKGGTASAGGKKINQNDYDDKAKLYCSRFNKKISTPVFYQGVGFYKCVELY